MKAYKNVIIGVLANDTNQYLEGNYYINVFQMCVVASVKTREHV